MKAKPVRTDERGLCSIHRVTVPNMHFTICLIIFIDNIFMYGGGPGGYSLEFLAGVCRPHL